MSRSLFINSSHAGATGVQEFVADLAERAGEAGANVRPWLADAAAGAAIVVFIASTFVLGDITAALLGH